MATIRAAVGSSVSPLPPSPAWRWVYWCQKWVYGMLGRTLPRSGALGRISAHDQLQPADAVDVALIGVVGLIARSPSRV